MLLITHCSVILYGRCCAYKGQSFHTLTDLTACPLKIKLIEQHFILEASKLTSWSSTHQEDSLLLISVNFRLDHCTKDWLASTMYYVSHCGFPCGLEKKNSKTRIERRHNMSLLWVKQECEPLLANRLLAFWKVHCTGNTILTVAYIVGCSWLLMLQTTQF